MHYASADLRSYGEEKPQERHGFVQIVLPLSGDLEIDVSGLQDRLTPSKAVFIHSGLRHTQRASSSNQSLIVDIDQELVPVKTLDRFSDSPFIDLKPISIKLLHHMKSMIGSGGCDAEAVRLWSHMLFGSFTDENPDLVSKLSVLKRLIEIDPFQGWTVERMAEQVDMSASRLHVLFREHFEKTPHLWLADVRMAKICTLLRQTSLPIAEIAGRAGFSDQTALTRAMKQSTGMTPAAYRRGHFS